MFKTICDVAKDLSVSAVRGAQVVNANGVLSLSALHT
jgi:hypothetical protein